MERKIHYIAMGGTFDARFDFNEDTIVPRQDTIVPVYLKKVGLENLIVTYTQVCLKDSRQITAEDRDLCLKVISESPAELFVITHGLFTMPVTGKYLKDHRPMEDYDVQSSACPADVIQPKTVVLTGAKVPLEDFVMSDAPFQLGFAFAQVQNLPRGWYTCFDGKTEKI